MACRFGRFGLVEKLGGLFFPSADHQSFVRTCLGQNDPLGSFWQSTGKTRGMLNHLADRGWRL
jgi:hypothetical protein